MFVNCLQTENGHFPATGAHCWYCIARQGVWLDSLKRATSIAGQGHTRHPFKRFCSPCHCLPITTLLRECFSQRTTEKQVFCQRECLFIAKDYDFCYLRMFFIKMEKTVKCRKVLQLICLFLNNMWDIIFIPAPSWLPAWCKICEALPQSKNIWLSMKRHRQRLRVCSEHSRANT